MHEDLAKSDGAVSALFTSTMDRALSFAKMHGCANDFIVVMGQVCNLLVNLFYWIPKFSCFRMIRRIRPVDGRVQPSGSAHEIEASALMEFSCLMSHRLALA